MIVIRVARSPQEYGTYGRIHVERHRTCCTLGNCDRPLWASLSQQLILEQPSTTKLDRLSRAIKDQLRLNGWVYGDLEGYPSALVNRFADTFQDHLEF